ncbi:CBU_0592 family membrane protein [Aliiglaciecola lipolytica]|uniref:CBU-0592-like domain-containing protein n=1 Tax=Aliiglaciecola lipolytica E3 TaxID=1127673 RepID=K6XWJ1_9ALTE|nr:hypothetical protein [Aliiglaciecola lipolytica]GAC16026.1 hypothetical protein GLIP_3412 [Aliiglaciecola lipolytica E3]
MITIGIGWLGTILYLLNHAYLSLITNWSPRVYYAGNLIAATLLIVNSVLVASWQAVVINGFWAVISLLLLMHIPLKNTPLSFRMMSLAVVFIWLAAFIGCFYDLELAIRIMGWSSALVFGAAYLLFCAQKLTQKTYLYLNVYAALALTPQLWLDRNYPVLTLEIIWALISIHGALRQPDNAHLID